MVCSIHPTVYFHSVGGVSCWGCCGGCYGCWWIDGVGCVLVVLCFFVLSGFVLDCGILVLFLPRCIVYCRVPGLHCADEPPD